MLVKNNKKCENSKFRRTWWVKRARREAQRRQKIGNVRSLKEEEGTVEQLKAQLVGCKKKTSPSFPFFPRWHWNLTKISFIFAHAWGVDIYWRNYNSGRQQAGEHARIDLMARSSNAWDQGAGKSWKRTLKWKKNFKDSLLAFHCCSAPSARLNAVRKLLACRKSPWTHFPFKVQKINKSTRSLKLHAGLTLSAWFNRNKKHEKLKNFFSFHFPMFHFCSLQPRLIFFIFRFSSSTPTLRSSKVTSHYVEICVVLYCFRSTS